MSSTTKECVIHSGVVKEVEADKVWVNIVSMSACASCHAKGLCNMSDIQEKLIEAEKPAGVELKPGEHVTLEMEEKLGSKAVLLGYFYPFLLVLFSLIILTSSGVSEGLSAVIALLLLVPYYGILYYTKDRLKKDFAFRIR